MAPGREAVAMGIIALLGFLVGALLALRWNLLVLVPVIGTALPLVALIGIARGEGAGSVAVDMMVTVTCIEAGFIAKLIAYGLVDATRLAVLTASKMRIAVVDRSTKASAA
jgi:hypothetical protein